MKDLEFLEEFPIASGGVYDNISVYENTLDSFKEAIKNGMTIYFSVRRTKDGEMIVYQDKTLERLMNLKDQINTTTYEELQYLSSYHIPTLKEALDLIAGQVPIIINPRSTAHKFYLLKEMSKLLDKYPGQFAILSDKSIIIKWFNRRRPDYVIGEIIRKKYHLNYFTLKNIIAHYSIITDFKSVRVEDYDIIKLKIMKDKDLILGYLIDSEEKYLKYKDACHNLFISNISNLHLITQMKLVIDD